MILHLSAKCSDMCSVVVTDDDGDKLLEYVGYVPHYIPNDWGDFVELDIDPKTGHILNWNADAVMEALRRGSVAN